MGASKHDDRAFPSEERRIERLEAELEQARELAERRQDLHEKAGVLAQALRAALGWEGGSVNAMVAGIKELREALEGMVHPACKRVPAEASCLLPASLRKPCEAARKALRPKET